MMTDKICDDCGQTIKPDGIGTGYATAPDGATVCYPCADERQAQMIRDARPRDSLTLYVASDSATITTWSGGIMGRVIRWGKSHPWSSQRCYISVRMGDDTYWHGIGAPGMYAILTKSVAA